MLRDAVRILVELSPEIFAHKAGAVGLHRCLAAMPDFNRATAKSDDFVADRRDDRPPFVTA